MQKTFAQHYKEQLEKGNIFIVFIVGTKYTKNGWTEFKVYELRHKKGIIYHFPINCGKSPYWNEKKFLYKCTAWGTDRRLEIILSIGYSAGLSFAEIKQNYKWFQS